MQRICEGYEELDWSETRSIPLDEYISDHARKLEAKNRENRAKQDKDKKDIIVDCTNSESSYKIRRNAVDFCKYLITNKAHIKKFYSEYIKFIIELLFIILFFIPSVPIFILYIITTLITKSE